MEKIKAISKIMILSVLCLLLIVPTITAEVINTPEGVIVTHYPGKFDGVGVIYDIEDRGIVINDMYIPFASQVRFMTPHSEYSSITYFKRGQNVGYKLNADKQISKLCLLLRLGGDKQEN